jgi:hypothetical protein
MRIIKEYEIHLNIDADEVYLGLSNPDFILNKLVKKYQGRCLNSSLITKITKIIKQSDIYCSKSRYDGSSDMDVRFEAEAIVYLQNSIIVGAEIKKVESTGQIICYAEHTVIRLEVNRLVQSLGEGAIIPVKVHNASYTLGKPEVTVTGEAYIPNNSFTIYSVSHVNITSDMKAQFDLLRSKIDEELKYEPSKTRDFFVDLFYMYKSKQTPKLPKGIKKLSVFDLLDNDEINFVMKHPTLMDQSQLYAVDTSIMEAGPNSTPLLDKKYNMKMVVERYDVIIYDMLREYLDYLIMIRQHTEMYPEPKVHKRTWDFYLKRKI